MFLVADRVSYAYNRRSSVEPVHAVRDVSVRIARGSLTGLLGPNGCGKTTLLKLLAGVLAPDSGTRHARRPRADDDVAARRRAADRGRAAGDASRVRLHRARDGADGPPSASRRVSARRARRSRDRARGARSDRHGASRRALVHDAQRRREAARRHRQRAGAGARSAAARRADGLARSRLSARDRGAAAAR